MRQRFLEDIDPHRLSRATQLNDIHDVTRLASWLRRPPDLATDEDLRRFQVEQRELGVGVSMMNAAVSALRFLYAPSEADHRSPSEQRATIGSRKSPLQWRL
ncbi:hypothetical protein HY78_03595 [Rhizorhabdus wittichii DC-6]|nr:hypothetical protein HY78_03595 [Rhizorhabdus wittichii DC-6]